MSRPPLWDTTLELAAFDCAAACTESLAESDIVAIQECRKPGAVDERPDNLSQHKLFGALADSSGADLAVVVVCAIERAVGPRRMIVDGARPASREARMRATANQARAGQAWGHAPPQRAVTERAQYFIIYYSR